MKIEEYLDTDLLKKRIADGYIICRSHPKDNKLLIYNYTKQCQIEWVWDDVITKCRGLICYDNTIIARPIDKFFELDHYDVEFFESRKGEKYEITEKLDGSLGIFYYVRHDLYGISTMGSFTSNQAIFATKLLNSRYKDTLEFNIIESAKKGYTILFEIIYPENRIIVNYGKKEDIIIIAVKNIETGLEMLNELMQFYYGDHFHIVKNYKFKENFETIKNINEKNKEGFVVRYLKDNFRIKIKFEEYILLHKSHSEIFIHRLWELLYHNKDIDEYLNYHHDDVANQMMEFLDDLRKKFHIQEIFYLLKYGSYYRVYGKFDKKHFAEWAYKNSVDACERSVMFNMYNNREYSKLIYEKIKPENRRFLNLGDSTFE